MSVEAGAALGEAEARKVETNDKDERKRAKAIIKEIEAGRGNHTLVLARQLEQLTGLESRVTILGHLQRGGAPSAAVSAPPIWPLPVHGEGLGWGSGSEWRVASGSE